MPATIKRTVEVNGEQVEVEVPIGDLPSDALKEAGFIPQADLDKRFQDRFGAELDRRVKSATEGRVKPEDFVRDDEKLRELRPDLFNGDGAGEIPEEKLKEHFGAWERQNLKPVQDELEGVKGENAKLRTSRVTADILEAFSTEGVIADEGQRTLIRDYYRNRTRYSPEHDATFLVNEKGEFVASGDGDHPYLTVAQDLEAKRADEKFRSWFDPKSRGGGGFEGAEGADAATRFRGVAYKSDLKGGSDGESMRNRVAYIEEFGYDKWAKLPDTRPSEGD